MCAILGLSRAGFGVVLGILVIFLTFATIQETAWCRVQTYSSTDTGYDSLKYSLKGVQFCELLYSCDDKVTPWNKVPEDNYINTEHVLDECSNVSEIITGLLSTALAIVCLDFILIYSSYYFKHHNLAKLMKIFTSLYFLVCTSLPMAAVIMWDKKCKGALEEQSLDYNYNSSFHVTNATGYILVITGLVLTFLSKLCSGPVFGYDPPKAYKAPKPKPAPVVRPVVVVEGERDIIELEAPLKELGEVGDADGTQSLNSKAMEEIIPSAEA